MKNPETHEVIPSARRLINSLRDLGYTFATAVADLIDNSIQAGATEIFIEIELKGVNSYIRIADNGYGMTLIQLKEALRFGSESDYQLDKSLGKFGLGLKTASLSQCRRFSVATRSINERQRIIHSFAWDLTHIEKTNKWEILELDNKTRDFVANDHLKTHNGTVVLWQYLDRITDSTTDNDKAEKIILKLHRELEDHISMVFHRFLAGEVPESKVKIFLNGTELKPWDPFVRLETKTREMEMINIPLHTGKNSGTVSLQPYILPHQEEFSSKDAFDRASGPGKWNQQQGFYIYRANRLIQSGGWSKLRAADEHTKLARVAMNFSPILDDAFKINVAKMRVQIPQEIKKQIEEIVKEVAKLARSRYDKQPSEVKTKSPIKSSNSTSSQEIPVNKNFGTVTFDNKSKLHVKDFPNKHLFSFDEFCAMLNEVAESEEKILLLKITQRLKESIEKKGETGDV